MLMHPASNSIEWAAIGKIVGYTNPLTTRGKLKWEQVDAELFFKHVHPPEGTSKANSQQYRRIIARALQER